MTSTNLAVVIARFKCTTQLRNAGRGASHGPKAAATLGILAATRRLTFPATHVSSAQRDDYATQSDDRQFRLHKRTFRHLHRSGIGRSAGVRPLQVGGPLDMFAALGIILL